MKVSEIMTSGVETISSGAMASDAARKMKSFGIGSLPVVKENRIVGVISGQDIIFRCIAEDRNPQKTPISEVMTTELACCSEDENIEEAARIMEDRQIHRLLVLDSNNNPAGVLSLGDLAVKTHNEHLAWEVLESISEPACPYRRSQ